MTPFRFFHRLHRIGDKRRVALGIAGVLGLSAAVWQSSSVDSPPTLMARGELSTPLNERGLAVSPSGDTAYYAVRSGNGYVSAICMSIRQNGHWSRPVV